MKINILTSLLIVLFCQPGIAQNINKEKLDQYLDVLEKNDKFMGSVAVAKNGELIYSRALGYADLASGQRANTESKYGIGSISKTFTAVLIMKAVEANKLDLDATIESFFPSIANANKISIRQLLGHRSGVHSFTNEKSYLNWNTQAKTESEMIDIIAKGGSDFEPGTKTEYSNSNYVLLSFILEKVYGKPYSDVLQENICQPLGLTNTYLGEKINPAENECRSYKPENGWQLQTQTDSSIPLGAGGLVSNPSDLLKFADALFNGKLLSAESLLLMETIRDGYGLGLFQIPFYDQTGFGHTGGIDGFTSVFSYFPGSHVGYALTSNGTAVNNNDISIAVLSAVFGKEFKLPEFSAYSVAAEQLEQYTGVYTSAQLPLVITISLKDSRLIAQATGQPSFPLEATAKDKFEFRQAGIVMEFNPEEKSMILKQAGGEFNYTKE